VRQRSPSPVREDPFEALEALEAMMAVEALEVPKPIVQLEHSSADQSHQVCDDQKVFSQCGTAHVAALALTQHNVEADAWDSDDDDEDVVQDGVGCGKQSQLNSILDFTKNHNALADMWDSDDEAEDSSEVPPVEALAPESAESKSSKIKGLACKHGDANETQDERKARKEARREARHAEGETEPEREARREARRERRSKRSACEQSAEGATQVEPLQ